MIKKIKFFTLLTSLNLIVFMPVTAQNNTFSWAKKTGGAFDDAGNSIATDVAGNVYTTGRFQGTVDFDPNAGTFNLTSNGVNGYDDMFIQKLDAAGNFLWAKQTGGPGFDYGYSIFIDANGNIITCGSFENTVDFDPGTATTNLSATGGHDIFIQKLDAGGNFLWARTIGGTGEDEALAVAADVDGNVIATGYFSDVADFDPGTGTLNLTSAGLYDNFIIKFDGAGNFKWVTQTGSFNYDFSKAITTDINGNIYSTGSFNGTVDFDPGINSFTLTSNGGSLYGDIFIQKLDTGGNFVWAKQMGWFGDDIGSSIKTDAAGNVYTTGWFQVSVDFDPGAGTYNLTTDGGGYTDDVFVQKLDAGGNFVWAKNMGGATDDRGMSIAIDNTGNVYTTGRHSGAGDFDPGTGTFNLTGDGAFLSKLNNSGNFIWAKHISTSEGHCITTDFTDNIYSTGQFDHTVDFDPGTGTFNLVSNAGTLDVYIQKLNNPSAGIDENDFDNNISVFPNPVHEQFAIDLGKVYPDLTLEIKNITGQLVYSDTFSQTGLLIINLKQPAGVYFATIISGQNTRTLKLIRE